jgi:hypothetical protein
VLDAAIDLIDDGTVVARADPELLEFARLARRENDLIRGQMYEIAQTGRVSTYEALFR